MACSTLDFPRAPFTLSFYRHLWALAPLSSSLACVLAIFNPEDSLVLECLHLAPARTLLVARHFCALVSPSLQRNWLGMSVR